MMHKMLKRKSGITEPVHSNRVVILIIHKESNIKHIYMSLGLFVDYKLFHRKSPCLKRS
jgi:hypothetical protein